MVFLFQAYSKSKILQALSAKVPSLKEEERLIADKKERLFLAKKLR